MIEVYICPQLSEDDEDGTSFLSNPFQKAELLNEKNANHPESFSKSPLLKGAKSFIGKTSNCKANDLSSEIIPVDIKQENNNTPIKSEFESGYNSYFGSSPALATPNSTRTPNQEEYNKSMDISCNGFSHSSMSDEALAGVDIDSSLLSGSSAYEDYQSRGMFTLFVLQS